VSGPKWAYKIVSARVRSAKSRRIDQNHRAEVL